MKERKTPSKADGGEAMSGPLDADRLLAIMAALDNPHRLRIIAALADGREYISELARRLGLSRPLLYMHIEKLEKAGLVEGTLELSEDGKAMKYYQLTEFEIKLDATTIRDILERGGS